MPREKKTDTDIQSILASEIAASILYDRTELSAKRTRAINYYYGEMPDTPPPPNRSSVVSRDVADTIDKMLPPILRTMTAGNRIVEYVPKGPEDEAFCEQASDYVSHVFMADNDGYRILYNATHDALLQAYAVVKHYWDETYEEAKEETYTGIDEATVAMLDQSEDTEILESSVAEDGIEPFTNQPYRLYDLKVKRVKARGKLCIDVIPPENFMIDADATVLEDARFVAHRDTKTRSELIEMGFRREDVESLSASSYGLDSEEAAARDDQFTRRSGTRDDATTLVDFYEAYIKIDVDGDGIAELVQAYYAGDSSGGTLLDWSEWDGELPFTDIPCEPVPHRFDGQSIAEKVFDVQQVKTTMLRAALDNQYAHNNPQPIVVEGSVVNRDSLTNPKYGQPIIVRKGIEAPVMWREAPYVGDKIFGMMEYLDKIIVERTGTANNAMALDPTTLQNQSATAAQLQHDLSYSRSELLARNMAQLGWKKVFRKLLKLIVANQDRPRTIRLRNEWVSMDPRSWNAEMDCEVNVGLGTGSRDRDMAMLQAMLANQQMIIHAAMAAGFGDVALEMLPKTVATLVKQGEAAGIRNADDFYPEFSPERLGQMAQQAAQPKTDPKVELEGQKLQADMQAKQADMQLEGQKIQMDAAMREREMQFEMEKLAFEREKMNADFTLKALLEREKMAAKIEQERAQMEADLIVKRQEMELEAQLEREKMQMQMQMQERQMQSQAAPKYSKVVRNKDGKVEAVETVTQ